MKKFKINSLFFLLLFTLFSCDIAENKVEPETAFIKIYDDENFRATYDPLDIRQTPDSGLLILSAKGKWNTYILKTNKLGETDYFIEVPSPFTNPLPALFEIDGSFYFFCMHEFTLQTLLVRLDEETRDIQTIKGFGNIEYPLAVTRTPDKGFIVQSYNRNSRATMLTKLDNSFNESWKQSYPILEDKEEPIISHLTRIGRRLPFFNAYMGDDMNATTYILNGYYNFSLSMLFVNVHNGNLQGVVNGYQDKGAVSAALHINGNKLALSRYSYDENYMVPNSEVNPHAVNFSGDIRGIQLPELTYNAPVKIKKETISGKDVVLFATETKSNQIVIYAYDTFGKLLGTRYWGDKYPYQIASLTTTGDGGIAILGKTFVAGRFPRITVIKMSPQEVIDLIKEK